MDDTLIPSGAPAVARPWRSALSRNRPRPQDARSWDADAGLVALYREHHVAMVRLAVLLVRDRATAEDVVQDAFVAVYRRWDRLTDPDKAVGYLRTCVVNGARSNLRHRGVVIRHLSRAAAPDDVPAADAAALAGSERRRVLDALAVLPRRQREVLALRHYLDLSEAEIATTLGISRGAVKSHASRGAAALRTLLEDHR
ncbi:MAG: polymerase subunit sigma-24 [Nocardioidaceae bacterium]|nr:polymerase subunit sigma-24 [Nocardioidaceae bacterium]